MTKEELTSKKTMSLTGGDFNYSYLDDETRAKIADLNMHVAEMFVGYEFFKFEHEALPAMMAKIMKENPSDDFWLTKSIDPTSEKDDFEFHILLLVRSWNRTPDTSYTPLASAFVYPDTSMRRFQEEQHKAINVLNEYIHEGLQARLD